MNWSWELWEWTAGHWRGRPALFPNSPQTCVYGVYADLSFLSSQDCFLPSLKWAVGAFLHFSITEKDEEKEEDEEEEVERNGGVNKAGWKRSLLTDRHPHKHAASDTWGSRSVFLWITCSQRIVPLLRARHWRDLISYHNRYAHFVMHDTQGSRVPKAIMYIYIPGLGTP